MATMKELREAETAATAALDAAQAEIQEARQAVYDALKDVSDKVTQRVSSRDSTISVSLTPLRDALIALKAVETKYWP